MTVFEHDPADVFAQLLLFTRKIKNIEERWLTFAYSCTLFILFICLSGSNYTLPMKFRMCLHPMILLYIQTLVSMNIN